MEFSKKDKAELAAKGITEKEIERQIAQFEKGFPALSIVGAATIEKGIKRYTKQEQEHFISKFKEIAATCNLMKFVPASGAATRMFKNLFEFKENYKETSEDYRDFIGNTKKDSIYTFFQTIHEYPFVAELRAACYEKEDKSLETLIEEHEYVKVLDLLLTERGLNLGYLPKALITFHRYEGKTRTPIGEHMVSSLYLFEDVQRYKVHFTISETFLPKFQELASYYVEKTKERHGVEIEVSYSSQKSFTDTVAVTRSNVPFRDESGNMIFRPGGHGALIHNLNEVDASVLFIKNIDNVVPDRMKEKNAHYEQLLGGVLAEYQEQIFEYLNALDTKTTSALLDEITHFIREQLCYEFIPAKNLEEQLRNILNRPLRVCGMVVNEGEPGGGPFLVQDSKGNVSLQIVESSQINLKDGKQRGIFEQSTHFNPVDVVCGVKDYKGNAFDLLQYVDEQAGFITQKSLKGRNLKALELPGLWNGAMANWNTVFVEIPDFTFNPVKTVFDLLRPQHRN